MELDLLQLEDMRIIQSLDENKQIVYKFFVCFGFNDYNLGMFKNRVSDCSLDGFKDCFVYTWDEIKALFLKLEKLTKTKLLTNFSGNLVALRNKCLTKLDGLFEKLEFLKDNSLRTINNMDVKNFINYCKALLRVCSVDYDFCDNVSNHLYFEELFDEKIKLLHSLGYCCAKEDVNEFAKKYGRALINCDVDRLKELIEEAHKIIFENWATSMTNFNDYRPGEPFKFLCHSVAGSDYFKDFHSKFVSASLFTEKMMSSFNKGYGFILEPSNIVAASDEDLNVDNDVEDKNHLYYNSPILPAQSIDEVIENCYKAMKKSGIWDIYNEVVLEGFKPIGIFALIDGSKDFDANRREAYELQKNFPELEVKEIDKTLYFEDDESRRIFITELISNILCYKRENNIAYKPHRAIMISSGIFNDFWDGFMELKRNGNYQTEDIMRLLDNEDDLIFGEIDVDNLFERYNDRELYKILNYSEYIGTYYLNVDKKESCRFVVLDGIYTKLGKYTGDIRLDKYLPGLSTFLELYGIMKKLKINMRAFDCFETLEETNSFCKKCIEEYEVASNPTGVKKLQKVNKGAKK